MVVCNTYKVDDITPSLYRAISQWKNWYIFFHVVFGSENPVAILYVPTNTIFTSIPFASMWSVRLIHPDRPFCVCVGSIQTTTSRNGRSISNWPQSKYTMAFVDFSRSIERKIRNAACDFHWIYFIHWFEIQLNCITQISSIQTSQTMPKPEQQNDKNVQTFPSHLVDLLVHFTRFLFFSYTETEHNLVDCFLFSARLLRNRQTNKPKRIERTREATHTTKRANGNGNSRTMNKKNMKFSRCSLAPTRICEYSLFPKSVPICVLFTFNYNFPNTLILWYTPQ